MQPGSFPAQSGSSAVFISAVDHGDDGFLGHGRDGFLARDAARVWSICHHKQNFILCDVEILQEQQTEDNASLNRQVGNSVLNDVDSEERMRVLVSWCSASLIQKEV